MTLHFYFSDSIFKQPSLHCEGICVRVLAARDARVVVRTTLQIEQRAQGRPGASAHPRPACRKSSTRQNHRCGRSSGLPCAMVLQLIRALLGDHRLVATVVSGTEPASLAPASERQDHTTSSSAAMPLVSSTLPRPSHPAANVVTIAKRPSCGAGRGIHNAVSTKSRSEIFFADELDKTPEFGNAETACRANHRRGKSSRDERSAPDPPSSFRNDAPASNPQSTTADHGYRFRTQSIKGACRNHNGRCTGGLRGWGGCNPSEIVCCRDHRTSPASPDNLFATACTHGAKRGNQSPLISLR
jgi:hypothetical protein